MPTRKNIWDEPTSQYNFSCERIALKQVYLLSTDMLLDLYIDYHTLYELTGETKFGARARVYKQAFLTKVGPKRGVS